MGNAAGAAGLSALMAGGRRPRVVRPGGRALSRELGACAAGELGTADRRDQGAHPCGRLGRRRRRRAVGAGGPGADESDSPIGSYAAALAFAVLGEREGVRVHSDYARTHEAFPSEVADALAFIAAEDVVGYVEAVEDVLESFETRDEYLEDVPVADTVLVLQALAGRRDMAAELDSALLP